MSATDELWFTRIESEVFNAIMTEYNSNLKPIYGDAYFTDTAVTETPPNFPCIEIRELEGVERGHTIKGDEISAYMSTFQVNVYAENKADSRALVGEIISLFKKELQFSIVGMPVCANIDGIFRYSSRCRRMIGAGDSIVI